MIRGQVTISLPSSLADPRPRRRDFRRRSNYLVAWLSEELRGSIRRAARRRAHGVAPTAPGEWREGLILGPAHIGDVLYNTASLPALRAGLPNCRWTYLASGASAEVLEGNPHLSRVLAIDDSGGFRAYLARARGELARYHFDVAIAYAVGSSWRDLSLAALAGIPNRVGYVHKGFSGLVTHPVSLHFPQPFPAYFRDLVGQIAENAQAGATSLRPLVYLKAEHEAAVDRISSQRGLDWGKQPVLACAVTTRQRSGTWPPEDFLASIQAVRRQAPCTVVYLGAKSDAAELDRLAAQTGPDTFVLAGELGLLAVVALLRRCRAALTGDSGARHLANAAGVPVVFVRNIANRAVETGAYCETEHDMAPPGVECVLPAREGSVWAKINPQDVTGKVVELLRRQS
jgi:heptosyltransferase-2